MMQERDTQWEEIEREREREKIIGEWNQLSNFIMAFWYHTNDCIARRKWNKKRDERGGKK